MHKFVKMMGVNLLVAAIAALPFVATADTYYASPDGTGAGTEDDPFSLTTGISKVKDRSNTLILKEGRYLLTKAIAFNGTTSGDPTIVCGETGNPADVILDAQGKSEVMRINNNVLVTGITMVNGSNVSFTNSPGNRASGVRVSSDTSTAGTLCVVSNCVITCCTNEFNNSTKDSDNNVVYGGAVAVFVNGLLVDSYVTNNTASYRCGGVLVYNGTVSNCEIAGNTAVDSGGGLVVERNATALVADSTICNNVSANGAGVANIVPGAQLTLTNCTITGNSAASGVGGGLYLANTTTTQSQNCHIEQNEAKTGGGTRIHGEAVGLFNGCVFDGNTGNGTADNTGGGACFANGRSGNGIASFTNCVFRNNTSADRGGAFNGGWGGNPIRVEFVSCVITNNTSTKHGGGICARDVKNGSENLSILLRNCLIAFNSATTSSTSGGGIFLAATNAVIDACTIVSNSIPSGSGVGAGLCHRLGGIVTNTIIACNFRSGNNDSSSWWLDTATASDAYRNCCVWPEAPSVFLADNGCVKADPKFSNAAAGDFSLAHGSPCVNAGVTEDWMAGAFDLFGGKRVSGRGADMGCYELFIPPGLILFVR